MPELPEVEALALDLKGRLADRAIAKVHVVAINALKTFDPPVQALEGTLVEDVTRHGKFLDIETSGLHLILHLARFPEHSRAARNEQSLPIVRVHVICCLAVYGTGK